MPRRSLPFGLLLTLLTFPVLAADGLKPVNFVRDVRPILARNCFACHGPDDQHREAELRLDTREGALASHDGKQAVVPADSAASELVRRIQSANGDEVMPPKDSGKALTPEQIDILKRWVAEGAPWGTHWSFDRPVRPVPPIVNQSTWPISDLDRFVLARLEREGLSPSPEADKHTLARRVALDLTGLPPDSAVLSKYLNDASPQAYERLVDDLLKSPAFGERWARMWLDLARYADTKGYEKDLARTMWRYRDWVIDAFNSDMPYDQFTREQLAGDLLPQATMEQQLATAFHRNTMINDEGGTDNEEFRVAAVKDRVDTTLQVWMGLTFGCAKCHSHKYDPLTQREYYQFYAYFNQTEDADDFDERPKLATPTPAQVEQQIRLKAEIAKLELQRDTVSPELKQFADDWAAKMSQTRGWSVPVPREMSAASGSTLKRLDDGSVLAEAKSPAKETYTVSLPVGISRLTGLKLEALPDKSHPKQGVGRSPNDGNFVLSRITLSVKGPEGTPATEIVLTGAKADFSQADYPVEQSIKNPDITKRGWAVSPQQTTARTAVFTPAEPVALKQGSELVVTLDHQFEFSYPGFSIGRFRLSVTSDDEPSLQGNVPEPILAITRIAPAERTAAQQAQLYKHVASFTPVTQPIRDQLARLQQELAAPVPQTPVLRELPDGKRRTTKIHVRGNFLQPGDAVEPAVPASFHSFPEGAPQNRLGVAAWLTDPANPLTARVAVNRIWAQFFGTGLVESQEDFGSQGQPPTHPELLDWLATEFMGLPAGPGTPSASTPWSFKRLCKLIVMSATYRQSSRTTPELLERDRFNRLLARGPRFRLEAEMIRDNALAASGLLSHKMYGPSVMPPQPEGIWQSTYNTTKWETSQGEDRYRRGLYTFIKRTTPYPAMTTFDAPSRELCVVRRINTNTPLQALVTLNDPAFVETAQALARRMIHEAGPKLEDRLAKGLELALVRPARPQEVAVLARLFDSRREYYAAHSDEAHKLATDPIGPAPTGVSEIELAAMTAVGNVILNLDEFITRN
ncbi:MAG: PSD1 domain-containing protein [Planctomycetes bacterium]|nr:PSD1 domain-containing protein [Planctomycetota bacterium]